MILEYVNICCCHLFVVVVVSLSLSSSSSLLSLLFLLLLRRYAACTGVQTVFTRIHQVYLFLILLFPSFLTITMTTWCATFSLISIQLPCNKLKVLAQLVYIYGSNIINLSKRYVDCRNDLFYTTDLKEICIDSAFISYSSYLHSLLF